MKNNHLFLACVAALLFPAAVWGKQWIDVTESYLVNPGFENDLTTGWTWESNAGSQKTGYGCMEFWNGTFDFHQTVSGLPDGRYRISVQAYYRVQDNNQGYQDYQSGGEVIVGYLYAGESQTQLTSVYAHSLTENYAGGCWTPGRWGSGIYYPNTMQSAAYCFEQGMYNNQLETEVTGGELTIGTKAESYTGGNWCIMDNFKLEYYGDVTAVSSITLDQTSLTLVAGEERTLKATVSPEDATIRKLEWGSSNTDVVTVDGNGRLYAVAPGSAAVRATATDGSGVYGHCSVTVKKVEATAESVVINEIQSAGVDMFVDPSFNYGCWIELYNPTEQAVSLNGCYVSDDADNLKKYCLGNYGGAIPAKGYKVLWFEHHSDRAPSQIDFDLDPEGGVIYVSNPDGEMLAGESYPESITRTSYARTTDGGNDWNYTADATPGKSNNGSRFADVRLDDPVVDRNGGLFSGTMTVNVTIPEGATLRYTTDGTTPTEENGEVSTDGRFEVAGTSIYRFRLYREGYLPSRVITRSYLLKERDYTLPIVSVVTDPVNLYDDSLGIYVKGVNGRTGNGQSTPCNWNMEWDRPVNFEYIMPDGEGQAVINQEVNMEMCGGWSRAWTPHSFKLKANKVYEGMNYMPYPIFADKANLKHKTLQIRNGGNDTSSRIKDAALQEIVHSSGLDVDGQECQPVVHFLNGEYMGVLNIREPNNKHFVETNYGWDDEEIDQFEMSPDSNYVQKCGTDEAYQLWYDLSANAADEEVYGQICDLVDMDEYINYMAVEMYLGSTDWPQNNIKGFRPRMEGGKFRFVLFDLDGTLATTSPFTTFEYKKNYTFDYIYDTGTRLTAEIKWVTIFLNMLQNATFRKKFADTFCLVTGSVFVPERCNAIIDSMASLTETALAWEGCSPWNTANSLKNGLASRQSTLMASMREYGRMQLTGVEEQTFTLRSDLPQGRILVNGMEVPTGKFSGTLFAPITLKAEVPAGYKFAGWAETNASSVSLFEKGSGWNYYDQGSLDGTGWTAQTYAATSWGEGSAPLGYFTSDADNARGYNTFLDYGDNASAKRPTYYFRKSFTLDYTPGGDDEYTLHYTVDDGMVVYINGQEAARYLMPDGEPTYSTYASTYANGNPDSGTLSLPASLFKKGDNVVAVEVHNNNASSTDIYFDAALTVVTAQAGRTFVCTDEEFDLPMDAPLSLTACYEPLTEGEIAAEFGNLPPVRINEISADNSIYVNDYYKRNDWIELYNTTAEPVDVAGMYLSDNGNKLQKYQIQGGEGLNTVIPGHGYLVIWADKLEALNQLHATFKLDAEGGDVLLTAADGSWTDKLSYPLHGGDESVGLFPDGGTSVYLMNITTLAASNRLSSYAEYQGEAFGPDGMEQAVDGDGAEAVSIVCRDDRLVVRISGTEGTVKAEVYDAVGRLMLSQTGTLSGGQTTMEMHTLQRGIYLVRVTDETGRTYSGKINK